MPEAWIEERLSVAALQALAAVACLSYDKPQIDTGRDGTLKQIAILPTMVTETGVGLDFQLKASMGWESRGGAIQFPLRGKDYDRIVSRLSTMWLIACCLSHDRARWLELDERGLLLGAVCFAVDPGTGHVSRSGWVTLTDDRRLTPERLRELVAAEANFKHDSRKRSTT